MAFNGTGTFVRVYNWVTDAANAVNITASRMDGEDDGFASGLSNCLTRDGQSPALANVPLGGFKITGLANGAAASDAAAFGQITTFTGGTLTAKLTTLATAVGTAGLNVPTGTAPSAPVSGDFWNVAGVLYLYTGSITRQIVTMDSTVVPAAAPLANNLGFLGLPQNAITASYTLVMADFAKEIYISGVTAAQAVTVPANASVPYPIGALAVITNDSNQSWSIAITTDVLFWSPSGGTGTRALAVGGQATVRKVTATRWWISGSGLT